MDTDEFIKQTRVFIPGLVDTDVLAFNFNNVERNVDYIFKIKKQFSKQKIVCLAHNDPYDYKNLLDQWINSGLSSDCYLLIGNKQLADSYKNYNVRFFSMLWESTVKLKYSLTSRDSRFLDSRQFNLSCLNRTPRFSKYITYYELSKFDWNDQIYKSFGKVNLDSFDLFKLNQETQQWFLNRQFPISSEIDYNWDVDWHARSPAYSNTYANIATETSSETLFLTEKTAKPLFAGNILFSAGSKDSLQLLRDLNFEVDFRGINQDYDTISNTKARIECMVKEIDRVYFDLPELWNLNRDKIDHNRNWLLSDEFSNLLLADVNDIFESPDFAYYE
jgi:hypothetical protein